MPAVRGLPGYVGLSMLVDRSSGRSTARKTAQEALKASGPPTWTQVFGDGLTALAAEHPDLVAQLHREFVHAGSDVVEAFTYYAHREKLRIIGKEDALEQINRQALDSFLDQLVRDVMARFLERRCMWDRRPSSPPILRPDPCCSRRWRSRACRPRGGRAPGAQGWRPCPGRSGRRPASGR